MSNHGKPVISSNDCRITKQSKYVKHYIRRLIKEVKSNVWATMNFLNKINGFKLIPKNVIQVIVTNFYIQLSSTTKENLNERKSLKNPPTQMQHTIIKLLQIYLSTLHTSKNMRRRHYWRSFIVTIYMGEFENMYIYLEIKNDFFFYAR